MSTPPIPSLMRLPPPKPRAAAPPGPPPIIAHTIDDAILTWVAIHVAATERQILIRFWVLDGRSPSHGYRVLRRLVAEGLLERHLLNRQEGRRSQAYVSLTRMGWNRAFLPRPVGRRPPISLLLQLAQVVLFRQATGWELVPPRQVWGLLGRSTKAAIRRNWGRRGTSQYTSLIDRAPDPNLRLWALRHPRSGAIRILVPVRSVMGLARTCHRISSALAFHATFKPVAIELVVGPISPSGAERFVEKWFAGYAYNPRRRKKLRRPRLHMKVTIHQVGPAVALPHPYEMPRPVQSVYARSGSPGPLDPQPGVMRMATRAGGVVWP